jgi:hypothetical protein
MENYNKLKEVPEKYLKTIQAGRLKGMSDIKPQWRILRLSEVFGECGFGWKIQNLTFQYEKANENEIVCNCRLEFLYKVNDVWSEPIPASGGSKLITMERSGAYVSDEAEKMAYTDAISVATKMIGLASDIYLGHGGKYDTTQPQQAAQQQTTKPQLPWLNKNTDTWNKVVDAIASMQFSIADVEKKYKLSKAIKDELVTIQAKGK